MTRRTSSGWTRALWVGLTAGAVLWPSHITGPLDGAPLDAPAEAIAIGLVLPALWWLDRRVLRTMWARTIVVTLLLWKMATAALVAQQGLCAATFAKAPYRGINQGIPIEEPAGALRSWDPRADWRSPSPTCTAILTRPLPAQADFPAWFLNVSDPVIKARDFTMSVRGFVYLNRSRRFAVDVGPDMQLTGRIDRQLLSAQPLILDPGTHEVDLSVAMTGDAWRFEPTLDGQPLWDVATATTQPIGWLARIAAMSWWITPFLVLTLIAGMMIRILVRFAPNRGLLLWMVGSSAAAVALAWWPDATWHRAAGLLTLGAVAVPIRGRLRGLRGAFMAVGVPWLAFFAAWSLGDVGRFSIYSSDDWLTYQVAGHRIYMQGYWIEGGSAAFDFQPFYRWMTGALHLIFGDSSVGEVYWDASCLLIGALLAFQIVKTAVGFRWAIGSAAVALATFAAGTPWHFIGRGLSEIAAAGWAFLAMFFLLRSRRGSWSWSAAGAVAAVLMFYTRLNHLLLGAFLPAMLLPLRTPAVIAALGGALKSVRRVSLAIYASGFSTGVFLFALRTWHYTGVFSLFYGTSLKNNDTGLRPWTLFSSDVWSKIAHSLMTLVWMDEPARVDVRALVVVIAALVAVGAVLQLPVARRAPAALLLATIGATIGSFFAHVHAYPGRFTIHVVPLASALTFIAAANLRAITKDRAA